MLQKLNILVVEDHEGLRDAFVDLLTFEGHRVVGVDCAEAVDDEGAKAPPDLLVVDLNLPGENGISLTRRFRAAHPQAGIIMVTASSLVSDRIEGFRSGVDIYLNKPIEPSELLAAVEALARRLSRAAATAPGAVPAPIILDMASLQVVGPATSVRVTDGEALVLSALARAAGQRLESWQIIELLSEDPVSYTKAALEVRMVRLRKKLLQIGAQDPCIKAVRGTGYQLCVPLRVA